MVLGSGPGCGSGGDTATLQDTTTGGSGTGTSSTSTAGGGHGQGGHGSTGGSGGVGGQGSGCHADADCTSPKTPVCDTKTGACVACTPEHDVCPTGQYCDGTGCKVGCTEDGDCVGGGDKLTCDTGTHQCVGCTEDKTCPAGSVCKGQACVPGCNANHGCQQGAECCDDACVDTATDPLHCGSCKACPAPADAHAPATCSFGQCGFGACDAGFGDCNGDASDGCETDLQGAAACPCTPGTEVDCYDGPKGTKGIGICKGGKAVCQKDGVTLGPCVGQILPAQETCENLVDDDCDGAVNEEGAACVCKPSEVAPCYEGPANTENVGTCKSGTKTCDAFGKAWGSCQNQVLPAKQLCTVPAGDQNCDGQLNEGCVCVPGDVVDCYGGPNGTKDVGLCKGGKQTCQDDGSGYGPCVGQVLPGQETCLSPDDENCNGQANEGGLGCLCVPNSVTSCYDGPGGTLGVGLCKAGTKQCNAQGTAYSACAGEIVPVAETCNTPGDDNCNGQVNEGGAGCVCVPGATQPCYDGPNGTLGVGLCKAGLQTCNDQGTAWLPTCVGEVTPEAETCLTPGDDDCNGQSNEGGAGCVCKPGSAKACYDGPANTLGVGICAAGTQTCLPDGTGYGACQGQTLPQTETCLTLADDDCDGQLNESGVGCVCKPGATQGCYEGPVGTIGKGICKGGTQTCNVWGTEWGPCNGQVLPQVETCATAADDNCDGTALTCTGSNECNAATGQCIAACSPELLGNSYVGCDYYPTVTSNSQLNSRVAPGQTGFHFAVAISNTGAKTVTYAITRGASSIASGTVGANSVAIVQLPWVAELAAPGASLVSTNAAGNGAYHLVTDRPVTVYQYNPLEYTYGGGYSYTNDASLLLPTNAWTSKYFVIARNTWASSYPGFYAVTASKASTQVTLSPSATGKIIRAGGGVAANGTGTVTLNQGDVLIVLSASGGGGPDVADVTGTIVTSTSPVQVIGGHDCTDIPYNVTWCDHIEEAVFPYETLSNKAIVTSPWTSANVVRPTIYRVVATQPNTTLTYDPPQNGAPATIAAAGSYVEIGPTTASFQITANFKIITAQYMVGQAYAGGLSTGDPAMAQGVAVEQYRDKYLFHAPTNYEANFVNVIAPTGSTVTLDGANIALGSFTAVGGTGYSLARVQLSNAGNGNHSITSAAKFGISVYGWGQYTSYWYPGGLDLNVIPGQ
jgi:hypothetical protein